jgi:hypothetical protein
MQHGFEIWCQNSSMINWEELAQVSNQIIMENNG